jgi:hypothetical protein
MIQPDFCLPLDPEASYGGLLGPEYCLPGHLGFLLPRMIPVLLPLDCAGAFHFFRKKIERVSPPRGNKV